MRVAASAAGGIATYLRSLPNPWFSLVHVAALAVAIVALLLGDTSLHLCGVSILVLVGASLRLHHRTSPQYRVMRRRAEVRRRIRGARISVAVPVDGGPGRTVTIRSTVLRVPHLPHDEVLVRADSPFSTHLLRSDLMSLRPRRSGESFAVLLETARMEVRVLLIDPSYLSWARGNPLASRAVRREPPVDIGPGVAILEHAPNRERATRGRYRGG